MIPNITTEGLSAEDLKALARSMELDSVDKVEAQKKLLMEKWSPWLGDKSVELGFPKLESLRAKENMALLLENQNRFQRSRENRIIRRGKREVVMADVTTGDESLPTNFALAMVRRAYALDHVMDWAATQPMPGPSAYVFYVDFIREGTGTNLLSSDYTYTIPNAGQVGGGAAEGSVPKKAKIKIARDLVQAEKQILATVYSLEAEEDALAQLGLNIANEMISTFAEEFVRNRFSEHLSQILQAALTGVASGSSLPTQWGTANFYGTQVVPSQGALSLTDWKQAIYNSLAVANGAYIKLNRRPANGIVCGIDMATRFQQANQATDVGPQNDVMESDLGVNSFGNFVGKFHVWATDLLPANQGFLYRRNPDPLRNGAIYSPYVPVQVMPAVYGGFDATTGNYQNTDEFTRNIRERSAFKVVRPYNYLPLVLG